MAAIHAAVSGADEAGRPQHPDGNHVNAVHDPAGQETSATTITKQRARMLREDLPRLGGRLRLRAVERSPGEHWPFYAVSPHLVPPRFFRPSHRLRPGMGRSGHVVESGQAGPSTLGARLDPCLPHATPPEPKPPAHHRGALVVEPVAPAHRH